MLHSRKGGSLDVSLSDGSGNICYTVTARVHPHYALMSDEFDSALDLYVY